MELSERAVCLNESLFQFAKIECLTRFDFELGDLVHAAGRSGSSQKVLVTCENWFDGELTLVVCLDAFAECPAGPAKLRAHGQLVFDGLIR